LKELEDHLFLANSEIRKIPTARMSWEVRRDFMDAETV
jgi:hypothetical protein